MLYELVAIARCPKKNWSSDAAALAKVVGGEVLRNQGVVRTVENWGVRALPRIINKNRERNIVGSYFYMKFDCSPAAQTSLLRTLKTDARVLRATIVRRGDGTLNGLLDHNA